MRGRLREPRSAKEKNGRWTFVELTEIYQIDTDFKAKVESEFDAILVRVGGVSTKVST